VTSANDAPAGADITVTTPEDTPYTFAAADFGFSDANDSPANNLLAIEVVTLPSAGTLTVSGAVVSAGQSVSTAAIAAGNLKFAPAADGNGVGYASFTFRVQDDGGIAGAGVDLAVSANLITIDVAAVDDAPVIAQNTLTINQGATVQLSSAQLNASDVDDPSAGLLFAVSGVTHGAFALSSAPAVSILTFTQAQVTGGQVLFVHDASTSAPTYSVTVSDGTLVTAPAPAAIMFSMPGVAPAPVPPTATPAVPSLPTSAATSPSTPVQPSVVSAAAAGSASTISGSVADAGSVANASNAAAENGAGGPGGEAAANAGSSLAIPGSVLALQSAARPQLAPDAQMRTRIVLANAGSMMINAKMNLLSTGAEMPFMLHDAASQPQWSIVSAFPYDAPGTTKEDFTVMLDSAQMGGIALSVGVVWWASRLGGVIGSLLASLPAWRHLDPLPVVGWDRSEAPNGDWLDSEDLDAYADEMAISMMLDGEHTAPSFRA
jgi:hypothetical protein